jgi:nicotinamidase-related amidase
MVDIIIDPCVGRCQLPGATNDKDSQPQFLKNIELLLPRLRELGVDVIWAQSEYKKRREFSDPLVEETILIFNDESSDDEENEDGNSDGKSPMTPKIPAAKRLPKLGKMCKIGGLDGTGPSRPPLLTDAYLSIETNHPPVAPSTAASEWHVPVRDMMLLNTDRIITKSWYSAFKETSLLEILRSRVVTQLCIVGLMTNIGILATAADAARHGLEVWVLEDCLGYRNKAAHDSAIQIMTEDLAVEPVNSNALTQIWGQKKSKSQSGSLQPAAELIGISAQALSKMIEGIKLKGKEGHKVEQRTVEERKDSLARVIKELDDQPIEIDPNARGPVKPSRLEGGASLTAGSTVGADRTLRHSPITKRKPKTRKTKKPKTTTVLEQDGNVGEGDSYIVSDILPGELAQSVFERVKTEVAWRSMFHRGNAVPRLVAVQGEIQDDGR